jgi:hypothetical protein
MINGNRISLALHSRIEREEAAQWGSYSETYRTVAASSPRFLKFRTAIRAFIKRHMGV